MDVLQGAELVEPFAEWGITAGRSAGSFGMQTAEPVRDVTARWTALRSLLGGASARLATAYQVHGDHIVRHDGEWSGFLRGPEADGHLSPQRGTAMAVTVADCVPVFIAHHRAGDRAARIARLRGRGAAGPLRAGHLWPVLRGKCRRLRQAHGARSGQTHHGRPPRPHRRPRARTRRPRDHDQSAVHEVRQPPLLLASRRGRGTSTRCAVVLSEATDLHAQVLWSLRSLRTAGGLAHLIPGT